MTKIEENELKSLLKRWFETINWQERRLFGKNAIASLLREKLILWKRWRQPRKVDNDWKPESYYLKWGFKVPQLNPLNKEEEEKLFQLLREWLAGADWYKRNFTNKNEVAELIKSKLGKLGRWRRTTNNRGNKEPLEKWIARQKGYDVD